MPKKIIPCAGYVLVEDTEDNKLSSGLVVAEEEGKQSQMGKVIECGDDLNPLDTIEDSTGFKSTKLECNNVDKIWRCQVKIKNIIIYKKYSGNEVELEGKKYKLVSFSDIIGIVK